MNYTLIIVAALLCRTVYVSTSHCILTAGWLRVLEHNAVIVS